MRILHITGQKPNSTGSGVYMSGLIDNLSKLGHTQCVIAGIDMEDSRECFREDIKFYPLIYSSESIPYNVIGMSDIMPYKSTRYKDLDDEMIEMLKKEFEIVLNRAVNEFKPDIIISNHLYLITSFVKEFIHKIKIIGICHGTCLRQLKSIELKRDYIISNIKNLDGIFALHEQQKEDIMDLFKVDENRIKVIGSGYNEEVFYNKYSEKDSNKINLVFAGKICTTKGLCSLIKSLENLNYPKELIELNIAGCSSDLEIYNEIYNLSKECKYKVNFQGRLSHEELANLFSKSHIFILPSFYEGLPVVVLEALACGCEVIVSNIKGMEKWMGDKINNSGYIKYIELPNMKSVGIPVDDELYIFENKLSNEINKSIKKLLDNKEEKFLNMENKTWLALARRVSGILNNID